MRLFTEEIEKKEDKRSNRKKLLQEVSGVLFIICLYYYVFALSPIGG